MRTTKHDKNDSDNASRKVAKFEQTRERMQVDSNRGVPAGAGGEKKRQMTNVGHGRNTEWNEPLRGAKAITYGGPLAIGTRYELGFRGHDGRDAMLHKKAPAPPQLEVP